MKKVLAFITVLAMSLMMVACGETTVIDNGESTPAVIGYEWPENEYTSTIPKPDMKVSYAAVEGQAFGATLTAESMDQVKEYAEKIIASGYNIDKMVQDYENVYTLYAKNSDDYIIAYVSNAENGVIVVTISISKDVASDETENDSGIPEESSNDKIGSSSSDNGYTVTQTWPSTGLLSKLPKPSFGTLSSVSEGSDGQSAVFGGVDQTDYDTYLSDLIGAGFEVADLGQDAAVFTSSDGSYQIVISLSNGYFTIVASNN